MNNQYRRRFMANGLILSCSFALPKAGATSTLAPIIGLVLDAPVYFSGTTNSTSSFPEEPIPFCITQSSDALVAQATVFGSLFFAGQNTPAKPNTISLTSLSASNLELRLRIVSFAGSAASGTYQLISQPGDDVFDQGTFDAPRSTTNCTIVPPTGVFSNCQITRAVDNGANTEIDFAFKITTQPASFVSRLTTIDFDFTFQPSGTITQLNAVADIDESGNGVYVSSEFSPPVDISGETSVSVKLTGADGIDEPRVTPCTSPEFDIVRLME
jgi:hypothetical protein